MSSVIDWFAEQFPDATPHWLPFTAFAMCAGVVAIILAGLFPSIPEMIFDGRFAAWLRGAVVRRRRAPRGRHHESPAPALEADTEAASDSDAASTARLGA